MTVLHQENLKDVIRAGSSRGLDFTFLPLDSLVSPTFQSHLAIDEKVDIRFLELVENIKTSGINDPIIVRKKDDKYEIVNGERRARAARAAGLTEIPTQIRKLSDEEALFLQVNENLHNQGYSDAEKTRLVSHIATKYKLDSPQIAKKLSVSSSWVLKYLPVEFKDARMSTLGRAGGEARAEMLATQHVATPQTPKQEFLDDLKRRGEAVEALMLECIDCKQKFHLDKLKWIDDVCSPNFGKGPYCPMCFLRHKNEENKNARGPTESRKEPVSEKEKCMKDETDTGEQLEEVLEEAEKEVKEEKTLLDDLSKIADGSPAYPFPNCTCSKCQHRQDCY